MKTEEENKNEEEKQPKKSVLVKPYSLRELAKFYGVCRDTMRKWINEFKDEVGKRNGRFYTIAQVKIIFENLGIPHKMETDF